MSIEKSYNFVRTLESNSCPLTKQAVTKLGKSVPGLFTKPTKVDTTEKKTEIEKLPQTITGSCQGRNVGFEAFGPNQQKLKNRWNSFETANYDVLAATQIYQEYQDLPAKNQNVTKLGTLVSWFFTKPTNIYFKKLDVNYQGLCPSSPNFAADASRSGPFAVFAGALSRSCLVAAGRGLRKNRLDKSSRSRLAYPTIAKY